MKPEVSVVIPVFQVEKYLNRCVDSVLRQTFHNMEIILVDDGSTDSSPAICDGYARVDGRVSVIHQENKGPSEARNAGLRLSSGDYIYFLDSDDYIRDDAIEILLKTAKAEGTDIVLFDGIVVDENDSPLLDEKNKKAFKRSNRYPHTLTGQEMLREMLQNRDYQVIVQLLFIRKQFLIENALTFYPGILHEDLLFIFIAHMSAKRVAHIPDRLFFRRIRENSITTSKYTSKNVHGTCASLTGVLDAIDSHPEWDRHKNMARYLVRWVTGIIDMYATLDANERKKARHHLQNTFYRVKHDWMTYHCTFNTDFSKRIEIAEKVIFYGAGQCCQQLIEVITLMGARRPDVIWDQSATKIQSVFDVPVICPDFETLNKYVDDVMVICIHDLDTIESIQKQCASKYFENVYVWWDMYDQLLKAHCIS